MGLKQIEKIEEKLKNKQVIFGTNSQWATVQSAELLGTVGYDMLWIDDEHGYYSRETLLRAIIGAQAGGMFSLVRMPWNDPVLAKPVLDMGADGILFPMVCSAEEARKAVRACKYPPEGNRGFGPTRANRYGAISSREYIDTVSKRVWCGIQIEHIDAAHNLDEILQVEGIDVFVVGPCDLSGSMGKLAQLDDPEVLAVFEEVAGKVKAAGKLLGTAIGTDEATIAWWIDHGADLVFAGTEAGFLFAEGSRVLHMMRSIEEKRNS